MRIRMALALAGCLLTAGCFEMKQDFRFNADETVDVTFRIGIDAALMALANQNADKPFCSDEMVQKDGITGTAKSTTEGGDMVCTITMSGPIDAIVKAASETSLNENAEQKQTISLAKERDTYALDIELPPMQKDNAAEDNPMAQSMQAMMLAKMSGRTIAWTVTAPQIIETSGSISEDGTTASYSRPLAEAFTSKEPTRFSVKFSLEQPGFFGWVKNWF